MSTLIEITLSIREKFNSQLLEQRGRPLNWAIESTTKLAKRELLVAMSGKNIVKTFTLDSVELAFTFTINHRKV